MLKADKERLVAELAERLRETSTLLVANYRGLTVTELDELRTELLRHGARFRVVKNTLTRRAAEQAGTDALLALLDGPSAIAFLDLDGDPVAVAKALNDVARTGRVLVIRGGILDGAAITSADVEELAKLPPADVLRAQLVGALTGPLQVVGLFAAPMRDFVGVLDARIRQLEEGGETAEPEPEPAAEPKGTGEAAVEEREPAAETASEEPGRPAESQAQPEAASEGPEPATEDSESSNGDSKEEARGGTTGSPTTEEEA